ncbi:related to origin recognition complex subunit 4 [Cephalotrichum gorgonifer]|uniref:Origin recognition complex subunit 4 n=1 Tax=Cephalotrichum gorgonifer TaxID=2041049 RepID=A0AAE8MQD2_9PEZI|nr:related to origin recognition complex subunit 4 [Cephalotrichum gorgonifer]
MVQTPGSGRNKRARSTTIGGNTPNGQSPTESAAKKRKVDETPATNGDLTNRRSIAQRAAWARKKAAYRVAAPAPAPSPSLDNARNAAEPAESVTTTPRRINSTKRKERGADPYDFQSSEAEELATPSGKKKGKAATGTASGAKPGGRKGIPVTKITNGEGGESEADVLYDAMLLDESPSKPPTEKKRKPGRPPGSKNKPKIAPGVLSTGNPDLQATPTKNRQAIRAIGGTLPRSPAVLKGILTPSKKSNDDTPRRRKSVAFGPLGGGDDFELHFDDLPTQKKSGSKKAQVEKPRPTPRSSDADKMTEQAAGDEGNGDEEEDEDVCEICLKPDSRPPNEIIFCDGCDLGFHQKCHNVPVIPEGDWLCKNCSQEDASKTPQRASVAAAPATPMDAPDIPNLGRHLSALQRVLLDRCTGKRRLNLVGLDEAYEKVSQLVERTIADGEGNSMLLVGGRGSGKTALIEKVVAKMSEAHSGDFLVIRLNGFIHTDDKLALKDIWRQLGKEMDVDDDLMNRNYADTMASLLAVLSHPSEITGAPGAEEGVTSQAVIFIIDEFDMFTYHPRQTLLYNLFDIAQARKAPIAVLGCTGKVDVVEMLEKRVKSRFSHRHAFLPPPRSLAAYWEICKQGLTVDRDDARGVGLDVDLEGFDEFMDYWSKKIDRLYKQDSFQLLLKAHFYTTKSPSALLTSFILPLSAVSPVNLALQIPSQAATSLPSLSAPHSKLHLLPSLSDLDLALLISASRVESAAHTDTVNFSMAYDEYSSLMARQRVQSSVSGMMALGGGVRVWGRGVAMVAWERLAEMGLLLPGRLTGKGVGVEGRMWGVDVGVEEIEGSVRLNGVLAKWCKDL